MRVRTRLCHAVRVGLTALERSKASVVYGEATIRDAERLVAAVAAYPELVDAPMAQDNIEADANSVTACEPARTFHRP